MASGSCGIPADRQHRCGAGCARPARRQSRFATLPRTRCATSQAGPEYVIGPDDVLHVAVWKEADLTATLPVRPDGKISLPLLNDVQAAGLTPQQLAASLTEKLRKYIADPRVTVVVTSINSKRIYRQSARCCTPGRCRCYRT